MSKAFLKVNLQNNEKFRADRNYPSGRYDAKQPDTRKATPSCHRRGLLKVYSQGLIDTRSLTSGIVVNDEGPPAVSTGYGCAVPGACQRAPMSHADTPSRYISAGENSTGLMGSPRVRRHPHRRN